MAESKACLTCEHFYIDFGERSYSEVTPGCEPTISCAMRGLHGCPWPDREEGSAEMSAFITLAENCRFYELHHELQKRDAAK